MKCAVVCSCGKLKGTAELMVDAVLKPQLTYNLDGQFLIERQYGALHPICYLCKKPAMAEGSWESAGSTGERK